jgi:starch synthase
MKEKDRPPGIAFVATECFPFVKVGGLADVVGSLPRALATLGARVDVIIPAFASAGASGALPFIEPLGTGPAAVRVRQTRLPDSEVRVFILEDGHYFPRAGVYVDPRTGVDYPDQLSRWAFFQRASLMLLARESPNLDVVHCHEHQTALIPMYLDSLYREQDALGRTGTVLTIHNLGYQGLFEGGYPELEGIPRQAVEVGGPLEFHGRINLMKGGILSADAVTVVSPTYAAEIQGEELGYGLQAVLRRRRDDLFGILNGIDPAEWNPESDPRIGSPYSASAPGGKRINRAALLRTFGLPDGDGKAPVLAMVSRIDAHKGFDILLPLLERLLDRDVRFVLVGTGDPTIEAGLAALARKHPGKAGLRFTYDDALAHQVMAGADIFLMPSRYEPCGLTQMYALRYGTVPVVRRTGGLADTVEEFDSASGTGTGFLFSEYGVEDFARATERALAAWRSGSLESAMRNGMGVDFSWGASARRYMDVYARVAANRRAGVR